LAILNKKTRHRYHTCKEKKEKITEEPPPPLDHGHRLQPKKLAKLVQTPLLKDARQHRKKLYGSLEQCLVKANWTKHSEMSIHLYSINQFYLIKEKLFWENISNKEQNIKRP